MAILSSIACLLEKVVHADMVSFCQKYNLLSEAQYGFRPGRSSIHLLEDFNDFICAEIDRNHVVLSLFIDLQKAFDTINHELLLPKIDNFGFRGPYRSFFHNYFKERKPCVKTDDYYSTLLDIESGVPQGSILGAPLIQYLW